MVADLTGMSLAGASLLDESTAAAEAMNLCVNAVKTNDNEPTVIFASDLLHPQNIALLQTRAEPLGWKVVVGDIATLDPKAHKGLCGVFAQYPATDGRVVDLKSIVDKTHDAGALFVTCTDLLSLTVLTPPGEFGADIVVGSAQRFGVPMGYGTTPPPLFFSQNNLNAYTKFKIFPFLLRWSSCCFYGY